MSERRARHASNVRPDRRMQTPYNFVPLPEAVLPAPSGVPLADASDTRGERYSGVLTYEAECLTPLYTRAARIVKEGGVEEDRAEAADPSFYHHGDTKKPYLPGSSLRGAIRSLLGLLTSARLPRTLDRQLFFRGFAGPMATLYVSKVSQQTSVSGRGTGYKSLTQPGFLRRQPDGSFQIDPCEQARVPRRLLPRDLYQEHRSGEKIRVPNPRYQGMKIWLRLATQKEQWHQAEGPRPMLLWRREAADISDRPRQSAQDQKDGWFEGTLVITGDMQHKSAEFAFWRSAGAERLKVPDEVIQAVNSEDQISYWQERAFAKTDGKLADGQPVWYLADEQDRVTALGRAQNFRLRHERKTRELIPAELRAPGDDEPKQDREPYGLDLAEALFGTASLKDGPVRGRVTFLDAACVTADPLMDRKIPQILSSPKPTAYQLYLNQPQPDDPRELLHYSHPKEKGAQIRGTKLYWHKNRVVDGKRQPLPEPILFQSGKSLSARTSQDTVIQPVKAGTRFRGHVHFQDLTLLELGALRAALDLPEGLAHRLGMGKPLGLGSLRLHIKEVQVRGPKEERTRYSTWGSPAATADATTLLQQAEQALQEALVKHHNDTGVLAQVPPNTALWDLPRSQVLRRLLSFDDAPPESQTRYVGLEAREDQLKWRNRHVLPGPHQVVLPEQPDPLAVDPRAAAPARGPALQPGLTRVRLVRRKDRGLWLAEAPGGERIDVNRVRDNQLGVAPGATVEVLVALRAGNWQADFVALVTPAK